MKIICFQAKRLLSAVAAFGFILLATAGFFVGKNTVETLAKTRKLPIYSVERAGKISISFDCAWGVEHTDEILDELDRHQVKCTFFAVQFWVEKYPEYAKKIVERGHELGTHSKTHPNMSKLSTAQMEDELTSSSDAIERVTGVRPTLFRPPFGDYNDALIQTCERLGLFAIQWDVDSLDWKNLSVAEIVQRVVDGTKDGSIILCHNNGANTAAALPVVLSTLQNKGFSFVPIGELIYKTDYQIDAAGRQKPAAPQG